MILPGRQNAAARLDHPVYDRELGCKTIGCFLGAILVMGFFAYLMNVAQGLADRQHAEHAEQAAMPSPSPARQPSPSPSVRPAPHPIAGSSGSAAESADTANIARLPALLQALRAYAAAHDGKLPPMDTPAAFRAAVAPRYTSAKDIFQSPRGNAPYVPNADLSGKPLKSITQPEAVVAFYEPLPPAASAAVTRPRAIITLGGTLRTVTPPEWAKLWGQHHYSPRHP